MPSLLQKARLDYKPKLPKVLRAPIGSISIAWGETTESMADQSKLRELFPHTYGAPIVRFIEVTNTKPSNPRKIGVVLSG
ncbi:hypothetical protein S1OALGB6SA_653, partial [Olavius algarvensis spirochete endosymbiont]